MPQEVDRGTLGAGVSFGAGAPVGGGSRAVYFLNLYRATFLSAGSCPICARGVGMGIYV